MQSALVGENTGNEDFGAQNLITKRTENLLNFTVHAGRHHPGGVQDGDGDALTQPTRFSLVFRKAPGNAIPRVHWENIHDAVFIPRAGALGGPGAPALRQCIQDLWRVVRDQSWTDDLERLLVAARSEAREDKPGKYTTERVKHIVETLHERGFVHDDIHSDILVDGELLESEGGQVPEQNQQDDGAASGRC